MTQTEKIQAEPTPVAERRSKQKAKRSPNPKTVRPPTQTQPAAAPKTKAKAKTAASAPRPRSAQALVVGGQPRVDLLPPEIRGLAAAKKLHGRLGLVIILLIVLAVLASGGAGLVAIQATSDLALEQAQTQSLLSQRAKYIEVRKVQDDVGLIEAARQVGTSTEIDWKSYLIAVQKTLPGNVTIDTVKIDSASPLADYAQPTAPLQGARIATLNFSATSTTLPKVPAWLDGLETLPGFADALPGSVVRNEDGTYTVTITMHINDEAYWNRFAEKGE